MRHQSEITTNQRFPTLKRMYRAFLEHGCGFQLGRGIAIPTLAMISPATSCS